MMNAHVVQYYWNAFSTVNIDSAAAAWAAWFAMTMWKREKLGGIAV